MDLQLLKIMGIALTVVLPITLLWIHNKDQKDKAKDNVSARILKNNSKRRRVIYKIYLHLLKVPLANQYINKIRRKYEFLYPGEEKQIVKKTMGTVLLTWGLCIASTVLILFSNINFNNTAVAIILVYVLNIEVVGLRLKYIEIKLLEEISQFLSNVRHNYHINRMVDDAIFVSMEGLSYEMKVHANKLYDIVMSNNIKEDVANYNATIHNKYLRMFLSLAINIVEYSDKKIKGQYLFTANIENLKKEVDREILRLRKIRFVFSGVTFVTISVIIPIDWIKNYGVSMMPELDSFYNGRLGIIYVCITLLITMIIYLVNNSLKGGTQIYIKNYSYLEKIEKLGFVKKILDNYSEKRYGKVQKTSEELKRVGETLSARQFLLQRLLLAICTLIFMIGFVFYIHENNKTNALSKVNNIASLSIAATTNEKDSMKSTIIDYVNAYKEEEVIKENIQNQLAQNGTYYNSNTNEILADEIVKRINTYQNEYFKYYELLICIGLSLIAYFIPYWMLLYRKKILAMSMEDEVNQFNSIIYMLMFNDRMTVMDILKELELFAVVYKRTIQDCINEYNNGDIEALNRMKEKETFLPFRRLVDNLIRCDIISIDKAFDEIVSDRENYHDRRKQEDEKSIQRRVDYAKPLSFIPTILVLAYLTIPLLVASLSELSGFKEMMDSF